jgi:hypothetical protein
MEFTRPVRVTDISIFSEAINISISEKPSQKVTQVNGWYIFENPEFSRYLGIVTGLNQTEKDYSRTEVIVEMHKPAGIKDESGVEIESNLG